MLFNIFYFILLVKFNSMMGRTIYYTHVLDYQCRSNEYCAGLVPNSLCLKNRCVCLYESRQRRQIDFESLGSRMLGDECQSNDECRRTPVDGTKVCSINQCQCSSGHVPIDAYRCIPDFEQVAVTQLMKIEESPGYGSLCRTNNDCQQSTVQLECLHGTCVCLEGYVPLGKYLCYNIRGQDAPVIESVTQTSTTTTFDLSTKEMIKSANRLGNPCTNDYDCQQSVSQSHCTNGICSCIDGYISLDHDTCIEIEANEESITTISSPHYKSLLGGKCLTNQNCQTSNGRCFNNICSCPIGYFALDDWNCFEDPDFSNSLTTTTTTTRISPTTTTTVFIWWPWSSSSTTRQSALDPITTFRFRCLLHRQCTSMDRNSHCTLFGRCVCNLGYKLEPTNKVQRCIRQIIDEEDCD